jgi:hypothetical protein
MASKVFFARTGDNPSPQELASAAGKVFVAARAGDRIEPGEYVAIKVHVGDVNNTTALPPQVAAALVSLVKDRKALPFITETATLYRGERENAVKHIMHAVSRGFSIESVGAPFIMADGLAGDSEIEVEIDGELNRSVLIAREARMADFLLVVSHMTGHIATGFGCTLKNLGMGLASRKGKLRQHSSMSPEIIEDKCVFCQKCMEWCPVNAITGRREIAFIDREKCVGCGQCLAVCRFGAVKFNWGRESGQIQKDIAEHALGAVKGKKAFYVNVLVGMTSDCDCFTVDQKKIIPDVGVLGSYDPVAIDHASIDLTRQPDGRNLAGMSYPALDELAQLAHGEKIGLGSREYMLEEI